MQYKKDNKYILTEQDFCPPVDERKWESNIDDIDEYNSFASYCEDFFELLEEEEYFDNE